MSGYLNKEGLGRFKEKLLDAVDERIASNTGDSVSSVNGKTGVVSLTAGDVGALSSSGGTVSGNLKVNGQIRGSGSSLLLFNGENNFDGATLQMFSRTNSSYAGQFYLRASTKSSSGDSSGASSDLVGKPDGTLTWKSRSIVCMPKYASSVSVAQSSITGGYTAPADGFLFVSSAWYDDVNFTINGYTIGTTYLYNGLNPSPIVYPLTKGDVFKASGGKGVRYWVSAYFVPSK